MTLKAFNLLGQEAATSVRGFQTPNSHRVHFDADPLASDLYLFGIQVNSFCAAPKMVVLKWFKWLKSCSKIGKGNKP